MARSYGQIMSAIWNDPEFRALTGAAQRAYLMLVTQADISSAGTIALTLKRWSGYAIDTPSDALSDALSELGQNRFIVVDDDTEELLVRKFVKWDGGWTNTKRRPAITAAANATTSPEIRAALATELDKLGVPHALSDRASDTPSDTPRVVVTEVGTHHNPEPETRSREPYPIPLDPAEPPTTPYCERHQPDGTDQPCAPCGRARLTHIAHTKTTADHDAAQQRARRDARKNCPHCHGSGWTEDTNGNPTRKCDHLTLVATP